MLPPAERDLAARDSALPGLGLILDHGRLAQCLGLDRIERTYLRYKPGTKCVLAFGSGAAARVAMAYPPDRYPMLRGREALRAAGDAVRFFDALCVTVLPATLDRDLRALKKLADPAQAGRLLGRMLGPLAAEARLHLLRHNPNRRAVLRLDGPQGPLALAKLHARGEWAQALANARMAEAHGGAPVLGVAEDRHLIVQGWVAGRPLWSEATGLADAAAITATGAALARLHACDPGAARAITAAEDREGLFASTRALAELLPDLAPQAGALAREIAAQLAGQDGPGTLLHGDFSADQVVIGRDGPVLIDWDRAGRGDPARDLGSFLARLDVQALDGDLPRATAARAAEALLAGYEGAAALPQGLAAQRTRALLALLPEGFRQRRPDWPERAAAILARAGALLPRTPPADPPGGLLECARSHAGPRVAAAAGLPLDAVAGVTVMRCKPGRRALLRYGLEKGAGPEALLGKLRAKGPDRRTPRLHAALRAAGLDGRAPQRVGVPAARGALDDLHLWLQDEAPGRRLTDLLHPDAGTEPAHRAGAALAALHANPVETGRCWTLSDELAVLAKTLDEAAAAAPALAQRLGTLLAAGRAAAATPPPGPLTGIHRDWYPDQILIDGDSAWILDLDLYAQGDPALDLGNFLAHVTDLSIRRHGSAQSLARHEAAFLAGYAGAGGRAEPATATFKALALARLVGISLRMADRREPPPTSCTPPKPRWPIANGMRPGAGRACAPAAEPPRAARPAGRDHLIPRRVAVEECRKTFRRAQGHVPAPPRWRCQDAAAG